MTAYKYEGEQTIPPGMTISEYRRKRAKQKRSFVAKLKSKLR